MALRLGLPAAVLLLLVGDPGLALPPGTPALGDSSHSLHYVYTAMTGPSQGLPEFVSVAYVDGQLFSHYDSVTRRRQPRAAWIRKVEEDLPQYWETHSQRARNHEHVFRNDLETARNHYNHSGGFHSMQVMISCELTKEGAKRGQYLFAYDGRDYVGFDKETLTWMAADPAAQITRRRWEKEASIAHRWKAYLEGECIEWLQRYLEYGKETLLRTEAPVGKVTRTFLSGGREMLVCQAHGFYPKEIEATWRKGQEVMEEETFRRNVAPNPDGTFHAWLSIEIDPEERKLYRCHIEHAGLREPLVLAWEAPGANTWSIVGLVLFVLSVLFLVAAGIVFFRSYSERKSHSRLAAAAESQVPSMKYACDETISTRLEKNKIKTKC